MKADYKNWMPKGVIIATAAMSVLFLLLSVGLIFISDRDWAVILAIICGGTFIACFALTIKFYRMYRVFSYAGKRQLSRQIIEGIAAYVKLPAGGQGLDVGCGSGALTIACAKSNPQGRMIGLDRWGKEYASFSSRLCVQNALAEGLSNVDFLQGDANKLPFAEERFDAVTSNYVYHNISGRNKQDLLLETLRVLKKGGRFALHDLMSRRRYGDMKAFCAKLSDMGYEEVRLIDTTDGTFMSPKEARSYMLSGSTLLIGKK